MACDYWFTHVGKTLSGVCFAKNAAYPTWDQAIDRLEILRQTGPTHDAFDYSWACANALTSKSLEL